MQSPGSVMRHCASRVSLNGLTKTLLRFVVVVAVSPVQTPVKPHLSVRGLRCDCQTIGAEVVVIHGKILVVGSGVEVAAPPPLQANSACKTYCWIPSAGQSRFDRSPPYEDRKRKRIRLPSNQRRQTRYQSKFLQTFSQTHTRTHIHFHERSETVTVAPPYLRVVLSNWPPTGTASLRY